MLFLWVLSGAFRTDLDVNSVVEPVCAQEVYSLDIRENWNMPGRSQEMKTGAWKPRGGQSRGVDQSWMGGPRRPKREEDERENKPELAASPYKEFLKVKKLNHDEIVLHTHQYDHFQICNQPNNNNQKKKKIMEKVEPMCLAGRTVNWCSHCGQWYDSSSKN